MRGWRGCGPDARPFVLTRSGYAGMQRYAAVWTGDNRSEWAHLRLAARMCLGMGMSGLPFVGFDAGGFWLDATGELLVRFTQLGAVFPFFRNHTALGTKAQEPWEYRRSRRGVAARRAGAALSHAAVSLHRVRAGRARWWADHPPAGLRLAGRYEPRQRR